MELCCCGTTQGSTTSGRHCRVVFLVGQDKGATERVTVGPLRYQCKWCSAMQALQLFVGLQTQEKVLKAVAQGLSHAHEWNGHTVHIAKHE